MAIQPLVFPFIPPRSASLNILTLLAMVVAGTSLGVVVHRGRRDRRRLKELSIQTASARDELRLVHDRVRRRDRRLGQLTAMLSQMRDGVLLLDGDGSIVRSNAAAWRLLQLAPGPTHVPLRYGEIIRYPAVRTAIADALAHRRSRSFDLTIDSPDRRSTVHLEGSIKPIESSNEWSLGEPESMPENPDDSAFLDGDPDGGAIAGADQYLFVVRDRTERQQIQAMRRDLVANLSHELKTPLAAIKGYAETIELALDDDVDAARHFMRQLNQQCRRMESMIADMLHLTRVQSSTDRLRIEPIDPGEIFDAALASCRVLAQGRQITLAIDQVCRDPVQSDREALLTILNNLLSNAIRYTPPGGHVRTGAAIDRQWLRIHVEDDGPGIPPEDQSRVFERFYRVRRIGRHDRRAGRNAGAGRNVGAGTEAATGDDRSGTGLGLSIVRTLTEALDGEVTLQSEPGRGCRFEVRVPVTGPTRLADSSSKLHPPNPAAGVGNPPSATKLGE